MSDDYEYAFGVAQIELSKARLEIERLQTALAASENLKRGYFDEIERLRIIVTDYHALQHRANAIDDQNERLQGEIAQLRACMRDAIVWEKKAHAEVERLWAIERAARVYYDNYCQDEANEEGICSRAQQFDAIALRDVLLTTQAGGAS